MEAQIQEVVEEDAVWRLRGEVKGVEVEDVLTVHAVLVLLHKVPGCPLGNGSS